MGVNFIRVYTSLSLCNLFFFLDFKKARFWVVMFTRVFSVERCSGVCCPIIFFYLESSDVSS